MHQITSTDQLSQQILNQRQLVLTQLLQLSTALDQAHHDLAEVQMNRFCNTLVDYLSFGHFRVFPEADPSTAEYSAIESTTSRAMAFSDRFAEPAAFDMGIARTRLDRLAEILETRFELEDQFLCRTPSAVLAAC